MRPTLTALCLVGFTFGLAGCSPSAIEAAAPVPQAATVQAASAASDGTASLAAIAALPEQYMGKQIVIRGQLDGWKTGTPALRQDGSTRVLPLLGDARHLAQLFPQVQSGSRVEISGTVVTNNTSLPAAVGIVPKRIGTL